MRRFLVLATFLLAALPSVAMAQPRLLASTPAAGVTITKATKLTLRFSEKLISSSSGVELIMTGMPGMSGHPPMPIKGFKTAVESDGKTIVVTLPRALPAGSYDLNWHVVGADQSKAAGKYSFSAR